MALAFMIRACEMWRGEGVGRLWHHRGVIRPLGMRWLTRTEICRGELVQVYTCTVHLRKYRYIQTYKLAIGEHSARRSMPGQELPVQGLRSAHKNRVSRVRPADPQPTALHMSAT